jgi:hypothetical protein
MKKQIDEQTIDALGREMEDLLSRPLTLGSERGALKILARMGPDQPDAESQEEN